MQIAKLQIIVYSMSMTNDEKSLEYTENLLIRPNY